MTDGDTGDAFSWKMCVGAMGTVGNINPTARIFYLDAETFTPLDAETYHLDMTLIGTLNRLW